MPKFELLVKAQDSRHLNAEKDARIFKKGDVIDIKPEGFQWGNEEGPPKFHLIAVDAPSLESLQYLIEPEIEEVDEQKMQRLSDGTEVPIIGETQRVHKLVTRRKVTLDLTKLKKKEVDDLSDGKKIEINSVDFNSAKKDKVKKKDRK